MTSAPHSGRQTASGVRTRAGGTSGHEKTLACGSASLKGEDRLAGLADREPLARRRGQLAGADPGEDVVGSARSSSWVEVSCTTDRRVTYSDPPEFSRARSIGGGAPFEARRSPGLRAVAGRQGCPRSRGPDAVVDHGHPTIVRHLAHLLGEVVVTDHGIGAGSARDPALACWSRYRSPGHHPGG